MATYLRIVCFCFVLLQGHGFAAAEELVPEMEQEGILRLIAIENQKNFDQIRSWSGLYAYEDSSPVNLPVPERSENNHPPSGPGDYRLEPVILHREGKVRFIVDMTSQKLFVDFEEDVSAAEAFDSTTGEEIAIGEFYQGYRSQS